MQKPQRRSASVVAIASGRPRYVAKRNALVEQHLPLVRSIAAGIKQTLPVSFDLDDLIGVGYLALVRAADRYRPREHGGVPFGAFARQIVRGAILDSVRRRHYAENTRCGLDDAPEPAFASVIETEIDAGRLRRRLAHEIAYLDPPQQAVIAICYTDEDVTLARAADALGENVWTIAKLRAAALENLRRRRVG
jgi:RNA polymerase sigma factor (sigma-70 family)